MSPASPGGTPGTPAVPALQHNRDGAVRGPAPAQGVTACVCERGRCLFVCAGFCSADPLCSPCRAIHQLWQPRQFQASAMPFLSEGGDKAHFFFRARSSTFPPGNLLGSLLPSSEPCKALLCPSLRTPRFSSSHLHLPSSRAVLPAARGEQGPCSIPSQMCSACSPRGPCYYRQQAGGGSLPRRQRAGLGCCQAGRCCGAPKGPHRLPRSPFCCLLGQVGTGDAGGSPPAMRTAGCPQACCWS